MTTPRLAPPCMRGRQPAPVPARMLLARVAALGVAALCAGPAQEQQPGNTAARSGGPPPPASPQDPATTFVHGQLVSRYWLRWTGGTHDQDVYETLTLDLGREDKDVVTGH